MKSEDPPISQPIGVYFFLTAPFPLIFSFIYKIFVFKEFHVSFLLQYSFRGPLFFFFHSFSRYFIPFIFDTHGFNFKACPYFS